MRRLILLLVFVLLLGGTGLQAALLVDFIDVGQGDAILLRSSAGIHILIDGGTEPAGRDIVVPYLQSLGIDHLDVVVATHPHADHIGGLIPVLETFSIGEVWADGQLHTTRTYERFLTVVLAQEIPFYLARAGTSLVLGGFDEFTFLHPEEPLLSSLNNNSTVVRVVRSSTALLFTGDLEQEGEQSLLVGQAELKADILKVGHHGSSTSSTKPFLEAVQPGIAVISCGRDNSYGHPHDEVLQRLAALGIKVYRTDDQGTIQIRIEAAGVTVSSQYRGIPDTPWAAVDTDSCTGLAWVIRAAPEDLQNITGIGPVLADRIVAYRQAHTISQWDCLLNISGIGPVLVERMKQYCGVQE